MWFVFLASFAAGPWQTNCYLVAPTQGDDVVVVDPGVGASDQIIEIARSRGFGVAGVLLTHGHLDHVAGAADLADHFGVPAWIHGADRELLTDAGLTLGSSLAIAQELGIVLREPADLHLLVGGEEVAVGGLTFSVLAAPGHRPGCVMFGMPNPDVPGTDLVFSGDVLFAGSIGRTDLPGGNASVMARTLGEVVLALPDEAAILPGHGPQTTMARERATNPYLQPAFLRNA